MRTVLIVTQDEQLGEHRGDLLSEFGFLTLSARTREEALNVKKSIKVDLIITDHRLGYSAALNLAGTMGEMVTGDDTPVLLITEEYDPAILAKSMVDGLAGVVARTESDDTFLERVDVLTGFTVARPASKDESGNDSVPPNAYSFIRDRDWFESMLIAEWGYSRQHNTPMTLMLVTATDLEGFIDDHGQDSVRVAMSTAELIVRAELPSRDTVARFDSTTIGLVMADTPANKAAAMGIRLRRILESTEFGSVNKSLRMTFAAGAATQNEGEIRGWTELKNEALEKLETTPAQMTGDAAIFAA